MSSLVKFWLDKWRDRESITSENMVKDKCMYPFLHDPMRTGRGFQGYNEAVLPFFQGEDFLRSDLPYIYRRPYLDAYRRRKRAVLIDTHPHDMLDHHLVTNRNHFVGTWMDAMPNMSERIINGNSKLPSKNARRI